MKKWNVKVFYVAGKEVLIKAILQSIPSYVMCVFKLSMSLVKDFEKLLAEFWWGSTK